MCATDKNDLGLTDASCSCGTHEAQAVSLEAPAAGSATSTYDVTGMTCGHCVSSVTKEISQLDGVSSVDIDLVIGGSSTVTVTSAAPLDPAAVAAAIDEAGYELAPATA